MYVSESRWEPVIREALVYRILDDSTYCLKRINKVPTEEEVLAAIAATKAVARAEEAIVYLMDSFEADVWTELGDE